LEFIFAFYDGLTSEGLPTDDAIGDDSPAARKQSDAACALVVWLTGVCAVAAEMMKAAGVLAASVALVLLGAVLLVTPDRANELLSEYGNGAYAQNQMNVANGQQLAEFQVAGSMQTGQPAPQGIPLSFQLPVPLPAPSPPAPTVITVGGSPNKGPECKRCERQMRKIKVRTTK
jgi:hypothetical protein